MILVLSGQDGSGKTHIASLLKQHLSDQRKKVKVVEFKGYFLINSLVDFVRSKTKNEGQNNPFLNSSRNPYYLKIWPFAVFILDWMYYVFVLLPLSFRYCLIFDRFFYDRLIGFYYYGYLDKWSLNLLFTLAPKPRNSFILYCDPHTSLVREVTEKHPISFYEKLRSCYLQQAEKHSIETIDSSKPPNSVIDLILNHARVN